MNNRVRQFTLTTVMSIIVLSIPGPAFAICDGCVTTAVSGTTAAVVAVGATITATNAATLLALGFIGTGIKNTSAALEHAVTSTIEKSSNYTVDAMVRVQAADLDNRYNYGAPTTDPCAVISTSAGVTAVLSAPTTAADALGRNSFGTGYKSKPIDTETVKGNRRVVQGGGTQQLKNLLNMNEGKAPDVNRPFEPKPNSDVTLATGASAACSYFAGGKEREANCDAAGFSTHRTSHYINADLRAQTIFDGPQKPGAPKRQLTIVPAPNGTRDSPEELAVKAFARNLFTPSPLRTLQPAELSSTNGRKYLGLQDVYDARMSLAELPTTRQIANLTATTSTIASLTELNKAKDAFVTNYLNANAPSWQTTGVSPDEWMNLEVERRYTNVNWLVSLEKMAAEQVAREQTRIAAQHSILLWQLNKEQRLTNVLLGALLGSNVRSELGPELTAAHTAASR